jgi:O-antigen/teichoic acid export membrane protein
VSTSTQPVPASHSSVGVLFKNIVQGSGLYSLATIGQRLASVILLPVLTRCLAPSDYGVMELLDQVGSVLATLLGANFSSGLGYFYFQTNTREDRGRVVGTTVMGAACIGTLAGLICWPFSAPLSRLVFGSDIAAFYLRILFVSLPLGFALEALFGWLRVEDRPGVYVGWSFCRMGVTIATILVLVAGLRLKVLGVLLSSFTTFLLLSVAMGVYCWRQMRPRFDPRLFVRIARFTAPIGVGGLALFVINFGDRFFLRPYVSLADLGLYALSYKIGMLVSVVFSSFYSYWGAQVYGIMKRDDADAVFARIQTYTAAGLSFLCLGLIVFSKPVFRLMAPPAYFGATRLIPIIVLAYGIRSMGDFFRSLYYVAGRPGADAVCNWLGAALCLGGYMALIPRFGVWGAAIATVIAFSVIGLICMVWTYRLRSYQLETSRLVKIAIAFAAAIVPYSLVPVSSLGAQIAWAFLAVAIFPAVLWILGFPTPRERALLARARRVALKEPRP